MVICKKPYQGQLSTDCNLFLQGLHMAEVIDKLELCGRPQASRRPEA
jgi:hypothetical protein